MELSVLTGLTHNHQHGRRVAQGLRECHRNERAIFPDCLELIWVLYQAKPHIGHLQVSGFTSRYQQETDERFNFDIAQTLAFYFCVYDSANQIIAGICLSLSDQREHICLQLFFDSQPCLVNFFVTGYVCKIIMYRVVPNMKCGLHILIQAQNIQYHANRKLLSKLFDEINLTFSPPVIDQTLGVSRDHMLKGFPH